MRLVFGLCVVIVCISPIKDIINGIGELDLGALTVPEQDRGKYEEIFDSSYTHAEAEELKRGIKRLLFDRFGVETHECSVSVKLRSSDREKNELLRISVILSGSAIFKNTDEIEEYLERIFGCEVITVIG